MYKYQNHLFPDIRQMWLVNMETDKITHMVEVEKGEEHTNKQPDGSPKRKYWYPIIACYKLDKPLPQYLKVLIKGFETIVNNPTDNLTKIWVIRDNHL